MHFIKFFQVTSQAQLMYVSTRVSPTNRVRLGMMDVTWNVNVNGLFMDTTDVIRGILTFIDYYGPNTIIGGIYSFLVGLSV